MHKSLQISAPAFYLQFQGLQIFRETFRRMNINKSLKNVLFIIDFQFFISLKIIPRLVKPQNFWPWMKIFWLCHGQTSTRLSFIPISQYFFCAQFMKGGIVLIK
jgi:hypothetical protein